MLSEISARKDSKKHVRPSIKTENTGRGSESSILIPSHGSSLPASILLLPERMLLSNGRRQQTLKMKYRQRQWDMKIREVF